DVDVAAIADEALGRALEQFEADCPVDLYLMVGVGAANAGELVVGGRGIAFVCLEHFTGRANPQTYGMGLAPHLLPLWIAHEVAHAVRYTSPSSRADLRRLVADLRGHYDFWDTGSRASLRELLVNEGLAVAGAQAAGAGGLLSRPAAGGELPRRTGHHVGAARRDGGAAQVRGARVGHAERMSPRPRAERRHNRPLREVLDDLLAHTRALVRRAKEMTPAELDYAQQRLEWLADEVWRVATGGAAPP